MGGRGVGRPGEPRDGAGRAPEKVRGVEGRGARRWPAAGRGRGRAWAVGGRVPHAASARPELSGWREPGRRRRGSHSASSPACVLSAPVARCGAAGGGCGGGRGALRAVSGAGAGPGLALPLRFGRLRAAPIPGRGAPRPRRRSGARGRRAGVARRGVAARPEVRLDPRGLRGEDAGTRGRGALRGRLGLPGPWDLLSPAPRGSPCTTFAHASLPLRREMGRVLLAQATQPPAKGVALWVWKVLRAAGCLGEATCELPREDQMKAMDSAMWMQLTFLQS